MSKDRFKRPAPSAPPATRWDLRFWSAAGISGAITLVFGVMSGSTAKIDNAIFLFIVALVFGVLTIGCVIGAAIFSMNRFFRL